MQTRGNVYAKLLFDAAGTRKRWLGKWFIMVQGVADGLDLLSTKLRHWVVQSTKVAFERKLSERRDIPLKCKEWSMGQHWQG